MLRHKLRKMRIRPRCNIALSLIWLVAMPGVLSAQRNVVAWGNINYGITNVPSGLTNGAAVAAGVSHSVALSTDGKVTVWGNYEQGQTNDLVQVSDTVNISAGAGSFSSVGLRANGHVFAWPSNSWAAICLPPDLSNAVAIAAGADHVLALRSDGAVTAWGANYFGQLDVPPGLTNVVALAAGQLHCLALKADGRVVGWGGANYYGEIDPPRDLTNAVAVAAGGDQSLALRADGTVLAWGNTAVVPALSNVLSVAAGNLHALALRSDGTVAAWGINLGDTTAVPTGLSQVVAITAGAYHNLAVIGFGPPLVLNPLVNRTVMQGGQVYFRTAASGAWPLRYQWQFNGTNLPGADSEVLALSNCDSKQAGLYTVIVSNALGFARSAAWLTVIPVTARILPDSVIVTNGYLHFSATATPTGTAWTLQASTNFINWVNLYTRQSDETPMTFTEPVSNLNRTFLRLKLRDW